MKVCFWLKTCVQHVPFPMCASIWALISVHNSLGYVSLLCESDRFHNHSVINLWLLTAPTITHHCLTTTHYVMVCISSCLCLATTTWHEKHSWPLWLLSPLMLLAYRLNIKILNCGLVRQRVQEMMACFTAVSEDGGKTKFCHRAGYEVLWNCLTNISKKAQEAFKSYKLS